MTGNFVVCMTRSRSGDDAGLDLNIIILWITRAKSANALLARGSLHPAEWCEEDQQEAAQGKEWTDRRRLEGVLFSEETGEVVRETTRVSKECGWVEEKVTTWAVRVTREGQSEPKEHRLEVSQIIGLSSVTGYQSSDTALLSSQIRE